MLIELKNCEPEFIRTCFPNQQGNVIVNGQTIFFLLEERTIAAAVDSCQTVYIGSKAGGGEYREWYANGNIREKSNWCFGTKHGKYEHFFFDGMPMEISFWKLGYLHGRRVIYDIRDKVVDDDLWCDGCRQPSEE